MGTGDLVVVHASEPREQLWGTLIRLDSAGVEVRGVDLANFEQWCQQLAGEGEPQLGPATVFLPAHRIERVTLDEQVGAVQSFRDRFHEIVGVEAQEHLSP